MERIAATALVLLVLVASAIIIGFVLGTIISSLARLLLRIPPIRRLVSKTQQNVQTWTRRNIPTFVSLWEFVSEILVEPLLFAFVVLLLFNRIQALIDYTASHKGASFWQLLEADMNTSSLYPWFFLVFTAWMMYRAWKHRKETAERREVITKLDALIEMHGGYVGKNKSGHFDSVL
jgi:large-conductance mechanosensitive channel